MGVALSHDLLRVSLCCSWLLCCKANFLFAIISKCHFYCSNIDARRYRSIECVVHAYAIIARCFFLCISSKQCISVRIPVNDAKYCTKDCIAKSSAERYKMLLFPVILIWDIHTMCIYVIYALHIWYYSDTFEINSIISTHLPKTRLFSYNHDLRTAYIRMRRSLSSFSRIIWEDLWQNFAFHRVSMRRRHNSHIFAISRQTYLYRLSIHPTLLFSRKNDFFRKLWNSIIASGSIS